MKPIYKFALGLCLSVLMVMNFACSDECDHLVLDGEDANIISCMATSGSSNFVSSSISDSITILVPAYVDVYSLDVKVELSEYAKIEPLPETISDWSTPVNFTVTSEKGSVKEYVIAVVQVTDSKVFDGTIRIGSQTELDNFFESGYTDIDGIVLFGGNDFDPIKDLSAMSTLKNVNGDIYILEIGAREINLPGLETAGTVLINSPSATGVNMPNLKFVAERFQVGQDFTNGTMPIPHAEMEEINLPSLEYVGGTLKFFWCSQLASLESLSNLKHVGKDLIIDGGAFENLKGLENIKDIAGNVNLNGAMTSLEGFSIETVGGSFTLFLEYVTDLSALSSLKHIEVGMTLKNNTDLKNLSGLENIKTPNITIENFLGLESLQGLYEFTELNSLTLKGLQKLTDLTALSKLEKVNYLYMFYLPELVSLNGLQSLTAANGFLNIGYADKLEDISALSNLTTVKSLQLSKMKVLTDISVFSGLTEVENLYLENLLAITDLTGLHNITKITKGGLSVLACPELTDLSPLANITEINFYQQGDRLKFEYNGKLGDYTPLAELIKKYMNANRVYIKNNLYNPTIQNMNDGLYSGEGGTGMGSSKG